MRYFARRVFSLLVPALFLGAPCADAARVSTLQSPQLQSSDFDALPLKRSRQNHLLVRAYINGKPAWLGVDSGAPFSAIALHRRAHFRVTGVAGNPNLPSKVQVNGGSNNLGIVRKLRLGNLELVDEPVVLIDLGGTPRSAGDEQDIDGIIGADILFPMNAVLDCQRRILFLQNNPDVAAMASAFDRRGFQAIPMQVSDGMNLYVNGSINGEAAKLMVDTGSFATLLHRSFVRRMNIPTQKTSYRSAAVNLKQRRVSVAHIRKLSVGSVSFSSKNVGVVDLEGLMDRELLDGKPPVAGLLGAEILNHHHGVIDFGNRTLYLQRESSPEPNKRATAADRPRSSRARPAFAD